MSWLPSRSSSLPGTAWFSLLTELWRLMRAWWRVDRIRVSPVQGELLRVPVAAALRIEGHSWTVDARWVGDGATGPFVRYQCGHEQRTAWLEVCPAPPLGTGRIRWTERTESRELQAAEIEVYESGP
jgi:hypothetical protein